MLDILKTRTLDAIYDLFVWTDGDFEFYDEEPLPEDLLLIEVEPTNVIMEGIYRIDELARYQTLVPSDQKRARTQRRMDLFAETRQRVSAGSLFCREDACRWRRSVTTCTRRHFMFTVSFTRSSAKVLRVLPVSCRKERLRQSPKIEDLPESVTEMVWSAERKLEQDPEAALLIIQKALQQQPNNPEAQSLLPAAEEKYVKHVYEQRRAFATFSAAVACFAGGAD